MKKFHRGLGQDTCLFFLKFVFDFLFSIDPVQLAAHGGKYGNQGCSHASLVTGGQKDRRNLRGPEQRGVTTALESYRILVRVLVHGFLAMDSIFVRMYF